MANATEHVMPPAGKPEPTALGFWTSVREGLRGSEMDFTQGSLGKAVLVLAVPMVLEMVGESVFAVVDAFFVARLGADALAAVGLAETALEIIYAVAVGLSMATTALVARRIGEKNERAAAVTAVQAILVGIGFGIVLGIAASIAAPDLLRLMGAEESTVAVGTGYTRWLYGGMTWILLLFLINAVFRGAGDAAVAMRALWVANIINIILDPCLIFGLGPFPELGLTGAGVATTIGRGIGVLFQITWLLRAGGRITVQRADIAINFGVIRQLLRISVGGIGQFMISTASYIGLVRILATFGSAVLAGYVVAIRIVIFVLLPSWGLSNAAATLVGQNLGARNPERAERSVWITGFYNMGFMCAIAVVFILFSRQAIALFTTDPEVLPTGVKSLRIISYGYGMYAWGMVMMNAFNGAGDTYTPTWINFISFWLFQIPLAWVLAKPLGFGPPGVFWAIAIAYSLNAAIGIIVFKRGSWKTREV
jgi:putative MATE family efflux protein